jgi:hypothetical protein
VTGAVSGWKSLSTSHCHSCDEDVPAGAYCGMCGATMTPERRGGPAWLRIRAYAAAPNEHLIRSSVTTSVFPRLPRPSRSAFRVGLITLVLLIIVLILLRWQPPLIGISAIGLTLLFTFYLYEADAFRDQSIGTLVSTAALSIALGIGWGFALNAIWARTYDDKLGTPMTEAETLINLVAIPIAGVLLMLFPVAIVRLLRPGIRESLDGFAIGALAALCFTSSVTLVQAAPEFASGLVADERPLAGLFSVATTRGIAAPVTAAAVGGMVAATLWFRPRADAKPVRHWYWLTSPVPAIAIALIVYLAQNRIDYAWIPYAEIVGLYVAIAVLALLMLRVVLHLTLLREASDGTSPDQPVLCPQCEYVVPDLAFCAKCGIAANAASRSSRSTRRSTRPVPIDAAPEGR